MFHVNRALSPNSPWKWRFFPNLKGAWNVRNGVCPLWDQNQNFYTRKSLLKWKAWVSPVLLRNCGSSIFGHKTVVQRGAPFLRPRKFFLSRSVLLKLIRFEWMSFPWKIGRRSWSQKLSPLRRCTKCSMLSVLSFNSPGVKLFSNKAHVGTFKEGTAFLGSDLGLRVLEMNLGPLKTEWKVMGPWSSAWYPLCQSKTKCAQDIARCSMLTTYTGLLQLDSFCLI